MTDRTMFDPSPVAQVKDEPIIVWASDKAQLLQRLNTHEQVIEALAQRVQTLEAWALQLRREPTVFTTNPASVSEPSVSN